MAGFVTPRVVALGCVHSMSRSVSAVITYRLSDVSMRTGVNLTVAVVNLLAYCPDTKVIAAAPIYRRRSAGYTAAGSRLRQDEPVGGSRG